jgi:5'(3')-deoxyribonucleotidase
MMQNPNSTWFKYLFLDMDGVCSNFDKAVATLHGLPENPANRRRWNWFEDLGLTVEEFWAPINEAGESFWENLEEYPWFRVLYKECHRMSNNVVFCTTPSFHPGSVSGKLKWLQKRFGTRFTNYIMCWDKTALANPDTCLIDDKPDNVRKFWGAMGEAILWPQPWNADTVTAQTMRMPKCLESVRFAGVNPYAQ